MNKTIDLRNDSVNKLINHYLYASIIGMTIKSIHMALDGIFVGNGVGAEALASVNIILPVFSLLTAVSMMIGVGSSTLISIKFGEGKIEQAQGIFMQSLIIIGISAVGSQLIFLSNTEKICRILGANDTVLSGTMDYGRMLVFFAPFITIGMTLSVIVRNDGDPKNSMYGMIFSAFTNIALNYIFIYPMKMGLKGAALATGIAQVVNCIVLLSHFTRHSGNLGLKIKGIKFYKNEFIKTLYIGFPSFVADISFGIVDLSFNRVLMSISGELAVSAFSIVMYIKSFIYMIFHGIGQAIQPIISFNFGAKQYERVYEGYHLGVKIGVAIAMCVSIFGMFGVKNAVLLFNKTNQEVIDMAIIGVRYMLCTLVFASYNTCTSIFFQAIGKARISTVLILSRSVICEFTTLMLLSTFFGLKGIWLAFPVSEVLFCIISMILLKYKQNIINKVY